MSENGWNEAKQRVNDALDRHSEEIKEDRKAAREMGEKLHYRINALVDEVGALKSHVSTEVGKIGVKMDVLISSQSQPKGGASPAWIRLGGTLVSALIGGVVTLVVAAMVYFG